MNTIMEKGIDMFASPLIGEKVTVVTEWSDSFCTAMEYVRASNQFHKTTGTVVENPKWVSVDCFCLATGNPNHPIAVINRSRVRSIEKANGEKTKEVERLIEAKNQTWTVPSSRKGKPGYVITKKDNHWSCTCQGFAFRATCRHINEKKAELANGVAK